MPLRLDDERCKAPRIRPRCKARPRRPSTQCHVKRRNQVAGRDWLYGFFRRHPDLAIQQPQSTNIARAVVFNRPIVQQFFTIYRDQLSASDYPPSRIWNMDETGVTNVQKLGKVVTTKGVQQVGKLTSAERGSIMNLICAMSAVGSYYVPPMIIFPESAWWTRLCKGSSMYARDDRHLQRYVKR